MLLFLRRRRAAGKTKVAEVRGELTAEDLIIRRPTAAQAARGSVAQVDLLVAGRRVKGPLVRCHEDRFELEWPLYVRGDHRLVHDVAFRADVRQQMSEAIVAILIERGVAEIGS